MFAVLTADASRECEMGAVCRNSHTNSRITASQCGACRLLPGQEGFRNQLWSPTSPAAKKMGHPVLNEEKKKARLAEEIRKAEKNRNKDRKKVEVQRRARAAERTTERRIISATKNSGRTFMDGDHAMHDLITLDTKLQTNAAITYHVDGVQLQKVREDAARAGKPFGALVIRNDSPRGVVAMLDTDFAKLIAYLLESKPVPTADSLESLLDPREV